MINLGLDNSHAKPHIAGYRTRITGNGCGTERILNGVNGYRRRKKECRGK